MSAGAVAPAIWGVMGKNNNPEASIVHKCRELVQLLNIYLNHFPRHEKYGLSIMGHASRTGSLMHMLSRLRYEKSHLLNTMPQKYIKLALGV